MNPNKGVAARSRAGTGGTFTNHGGPVVKNPQVMALFWGPSWGDTAHIERNGQLEQFLKDLLQSSIMNLLSQYGVGPGSFVGSLVDTNITGSLTDSQIRSVLQGYFDTGALPEPDSNRVHVIFFDEMVEANDPNVAVMCEPSGDNAFGYHFNFVTSKGSPCYYSVIPALDDTCIKESCGDPVSSTCSLQLFDTQLQRITEVTTHEFAEMLSDPEPNSGWADNQGNEIGDVCEAQTADIIVGSNTWRIQKEWDNAANACTVGGLTPVVPPPAPQPPPPGNTWSSSETLLNVFGFAVAKVQYILRQAQRADQLEKENASLREQLKYFKG